MREIKPFFVPSPDLVVLSDWELEGESLPEFIEGWDPQTDLVLSSRLEVDLDQFLIGARLAEGTPLRVTVSWSSSTSGMSDSVYRAPLVPDQAFTVTLPGERLGGTVEVRCAITLAEERVAIRPGEVARAGSVLWESTAAVRLDGQDAMFPVGVTDFAGTPYGAYASWHLQTSEELDAPFLGTFLLLINARDTALVEAINQKKQTQMGVQLVNELEAGVAAVMIELALRFEDVDLNGYPDDSVGSVLGRYLRMAHTEGLTSALRVDDPGRFRSVLESIVRAQGHGRTFE